MLLKINDKECQIIANNKPKIVEELKFRGVHIGEFLLHYYSLRDWTIECHRLADKTLGECRFGTKTIIINTTAFYLLDYSSLKDLILHEIAHALVGPEHGHDLFWKSKARSIGCDGQQFMCVKKILKLDEDKYRIIF